MSPRYTGATAALWLAVVLLIASCSSPGESDDMMVADVVDMALPDDVDQPSEGDLPTNSNAWSRLGDDEAARLQSQLDLAVENLALPGAAMAVVKVKSGEIWEGASGEAGDEEWEPERQFHIGSVTKTFTTAVVLQLFEEGTVSLDDPLERWVPGYYDGLGVTVRHLLTNTSGIVSYNYVGSFDDTRPWTPEELVEWAVTNEPNLRFEPGSQWEYSNTNFVLLGLVIEAATGQSYDAVMKERLFEPLGLDDTYVAKSGDANPRVVPCFDESATEITGDADPSFGWSAGAIVSTPRDMARWAAALYAGDVLSAEGGSLMVTPTIGTDDAGVEYGMGAFIESDGVQSLYGHTGGFGGYLTYMYFLEPEQYAVIVMSNKLGTDLRDFSAYGWSVLLDFPHP